MSNKAQYHITIMSPESSRRIVVEANGPREALCEGQKQCNKDKDESVVYSKVIR